MITFLTWYYVNQTKNVFAIFLGFFTYVADFFAIPMMIKHLWEPLYQDYTYSGRVIGFLIRSGRIVLGIFVQLMFIILFGFLMLVWLLLPLIIIGKITYISFTMWK